jgi:hypothetical protein
VTAGKAKTSAEKARTTEENQARELRSELKIRQENMEPEGKLGTAERYKKHEEPKPEP